MKSALSIYRTLPRFDSSQPSAVTIGNFDGVHLGHQAILQKVRNEACTRQLAPTALTFSPHPRAYFAQRGNRPELAPTQISSLRDKISLLACHGMAQIVLAKFDHALADMRAEQFIQQLLIAGLNTRWLLVGKDFRFGHQRQGDVALLRQYGQQFGFEVQIIEDVVDAQGHRISSSELRSLLAVGNVERCAELLGQPYQLSGHVIHGQKLGRTLNFPTLNLIAPRHYAVRSGSYVVRVHGLADKPLAGIASLGVRPTVTDSGALWLEVHLLDINLNAYGKLVKVDFLNFVREEEKFPDLQTLTAAIESDAQQAREYFVVNGL